MVKKQGRSYMDGGPHVPFSNPTHPDNKLPYSSPGTLDEGEESDNNPASKHDAVREYIGGREQPVARPIGKLVTHQHAENEQRLDAQTSQRNQRASDRTSKKNAKVGIDRTNKEGENDNSLGRYGYGS